MDDCHLLSSLVCLVLFYVISMRLLILGKINDYLPEYGLAWSEGDETTTYLASIKDDRSSSLLQDFFKYNCLSLTESSHSEADLTLVTDSKTITAELANLLGNNYLLKRVDDFGSISTGVKGSLLMFPPIAVSAGQMFDHLHSGPFATGTTFQYVHQLSDKHTTLIDFVAKTIGITGDPSSLLNLISKPVTQMGRRRLQRTFFGHPLTDPHLINSRQNTLKKFISNRSLAAKLKNHCLGRFDDLDKFSCRLHSFRKLSAIGVKKFAAQLPAVAKSLDLYYTFVRSLQEDLADDELTEPFEKNLESLTNLKRLLAHVLNLRESDEWMRKTDLSTVTLLNPNLNDKIREATDFIASVEEEIETERSRVERETDSKKVRVVPHPLKGRVFRVPRTTKIPQKYVIVKVNKGECQFTTSTLERLTQRLEESLKDIAEMEADYLFKMLAVCSTYIEPINEAADRLGTLDCLLAISTTLSLLSDSGSSWCFPEILPPNSPTVFKCVEGKHPGLHLFAELRRTRAVVANSIDLESANTRIILLTGPNMGGKSTFARQQAQMALLSQVGAPVPAKCATLTPFSIIWPRIGADDNPGAASSTFMTEAWEIGVMLRLIDSVPKVHLKAFGGPAPAMLVVDELGRGTSSSDGIAFAFAVLAEVAKKPGILGVFATHFHELAEEKIDRVACFRMDRASNDGRKGKRQIDFSFRVLPGAESSSEGIALVEAFGFPADLIADAVRVLKSES